MMKQGKLTKEKITDILRQQYAHLAAEYGVKRIGLFGSYAKGVPQDESDIDLVVEFNAPIGLKFMEFTEYLEHLFGTSVDVLTPTGIKYIRNTQIVTNIQETIIYV
jgi:predicted nucleotidyltransferase